MNITFESNETFGAKRKAEAWCRDRGISVGSSCVACPQGLLFGSYVIAKWRNLTKCERDQLHGHISGDGRHGPLTVYIKPEFEHLLKEFPGAAATEMDGMLAEEKAHG